jgi:large subunit ribosomal protein L24
VDKIRKGDQVVVIAGKDKGKRATVLLRIDSEKIVVDNVNQCKKHVKPNPVKGVVGGIVEINMPIHVSNVLLYNPATQKGDRVGFRTLVGGDKVRIYKSSGEQVGT